MRDAGLVARALSICRDALGRLDGSGKPPNAGGTE